MWEMSCSFFGVGVGEQLFAISTKFTKSMQGKEMPKNQDRFKKGLPVYWSKEMLEQIIF